jgi:hypothetical protein
MSIYTGKFITEQESFKFIYPSALLRRAESGERRAESGERRTESASEGLIIK